MQCTLCTVANKVVTCAANPGIREPVNPEIRVLGSGCQGVLRYIGNSSGPSVTCTGALIRSASKNQPLNGRTPKCWRCAVANMARRLCRRMTRPSRNPFRLVPADDPRLLQDCFCCTFSPAGKELRDRRQAASLRQNVAS